MQTDPIADFLTIIRNANTANLPEAKAPHSTLKAKVAEILTNEGFIKGYEVVDVNKVKKELRVQMKSDQRLKAIRGLKRISKPGLRRYVGAKDMPRVLGGLGIAILSTSRGILSDQEARKQNVGGELLCYVW